MRKMTWYGSIVTLVICGGVASASAQGFMTLDRMDDSSRLGFQLGVVSPDDENDVNFALRPEVYGSFLLGRSGGIYGQLPFGWLSMDGVEDEGAMQNLELGGFFLLGHAARGGVLRLGLSLPTAEDEDPVGMLANILGGQERLTDLVGALPNSTWLRLSASPLFREGNVFLRLDGGMDFKIDDDDGAEQFDLVGRMNAGIGVLAGAAAFTFELANVGNMDGDGDFDDRWMHSLAIGARILGAPELHFGLVLPLDDGVRGDLWIFSFGIHATM